MFKFQNTTRNLAAISLCGLVSLTAGCGSSSEGTDSSDGGQSTNPSKSTSTTVPDMPYSPQSYATTALTIDNAEGVAKNVAQIISYLVEEYDEFAETPSVEIYQDTSYDISQSQTSSCSITGTQLYEMNAPTRLNYYDYRVWGAGDRFKVTYQDCADDTSGSKIYVNGSHELNMTSGIYDNFSIYASPTEYTYHYDKLGFYTYGTQYSYKDGVFSITATENSVGFKSNQFTQVARVPYDTVGFTAQNLDFTINKTEGRTSYSEAVEFNQTGTITMDLDKLETRVTIDIPGRLFEDRWLGYDIVEGTVIISSASGVITIDFRDDYLDYSVDEDGDGVAETTGTIDDMYY